MALVLADRVQEYSTTTGTGTLTLSGAYAGFQTFAAGIGNGNTCYYTITSDKNQWEVGIGTVGIGTLARTTLISSSTGSTIDFQGTLTVFVTLPAEEAVYGDGTTLVAPSGALLPIASGGTGASTAAAARTALGLGTIATQNANAVAVTGGTINGTTVGATTVAAGSFSTLNSSGATRLGGLSGNQSLQVNNVASAVNYAQIVGATATNYPAFQAQGTDADVGFLFDAKANGQQYFRSNGGAIQFLVGSKANAVNYMRVTGQTTTNYPVLTASGSDANVGFVFNAKGTADIAFQTSSIRQAQVSYTASAVNYLQLTGAATGAAPTISAQGSDANINAAIAAKGTGSVQLQSSGSTVLNVSSSGTGVGDFINIYPTSGFMNWVLAGTDTNIGYVLTTKGGLGFYLSTGGGQQVAISHTASAVNYVNLTGAATGAAPTLSAQGSDANINLAHTSKGTGGHTFNTGGGQQFTISHTASAVDYLQATGNSGGFPSLSAQGASTNVSIVYGTKGTGGHNFTTNGTSVNQFVVTNTASAVNNIRVTGGATGTAPTISAQGSDANIDLNLFTKGTGVLRFGTYTAGILAQTGYITITDAGGTSRRLLVG